MKSSRNRRRRAAFTLIEVMLVLVILVILASLAVTAYGPIQRRARINAAKSQVGLFKTALGTYQLVVGNYPTSQDGLEALRAAPSGLTNADPNDWPMLEDPVPDDPWGNKFQYESPGSHNAHSYDVWSSGPDSIDGNEDDIGNWGTE